MSLPLSPKATRPLVADNDTVDRRSAERVSFSAVAELLEIATTTRFSGRVADISLSGCYVDVINVYKPGAIIKVSIQHAGSKIETGAIVVYSLPGMGMGLTFTSPSPELQSTLAKWIAHAKGEISPVHQEPEVNRMIQNYPRVERHILGRLIGLMMRKNMLSRDEGTELLDELLKDE